LTPDVRNLLRHVRVPGLAYRDFAAAAPARLRRPERRQGLLTIALVSLVPRVGRTVLCANLLRALAGQGARAGALDVDPRADLTSTFGSEGHDPSACIEQLAGERDVLLVDTGTPPPADVLSEADELVVVARPDSASLAAVAPMEALLVRTRMRSWRKPRARWLVNAFDARRKVDREALAALRRALGSRVLQTIVQEDRALSDSFSAGRLVHDVASGSQVAADLDSLGRELHVPTAAADRRAPPVD
jgi:cellulose biosynthesis protein BcsQ